MIELVIVACLLSDPAKCSDYKFAVPAPLTFADCQNGAQSRFDGFKRTNEKTHNVTHWYCHYSDRPEAEA